MNAFRLLSVPALLLALSVPAAAQLSWNGHGGLAPKQTETKAKGGDDHAFETVRKVAKGGVKKLATGGKFNPVSAGAAITFSPSETGGCGTRGGQRRCADEKPWTREQIARRSMHPTRSYSRNFPDTETKPVSRPRSEMDNGQSVRLQENLSRSIVARQPRIEVPRTTAPTYRNPNATRTVTPPVVSSGPTRMFGNPRTVPSTPTRTSTPTFAPSRPTYSAPSYTPPRPSYSAPSYSAPSRPSAPSRSSYTPPRCSAGATCGSR